MWGEETPVYTLVFSKLNTGEKIDSYTNQHSYKYENISWLVQGDQKTGSGIGVRVGGKNKTQTDCPITSQEKISSKAISKVRINHNGTTNGANSTITINSIKVEGSISSVFESSKTKQIDNPSVSSAGTLDFTLDEGSWDAKSFFKITVNYKVETSASSANNCYFMIDSINFYEAEVAPTTKRIYISLFNDWKKDNAKTGIYDATNGQWMTNFATEGIGSESGYYYDDIPTSCNKITIGRFSPSATQPSGWSGDNFWGQSVDFDITNNNLIKLQGWGNTGDANGKGYGSLSNLYSIGEATYTNCSLSSGSWPTCLQESGTAFNLTISADEGYKLNSKVTASGCTAEWSPALDQDATSGTLHVTITGDNASIAVNAISDEYTVTWMADGVKHDSKTDYTYNNALVMPTANPQPCDRNHFIGWTATQNYSSSTERPSDLFTEAGDKKVTADITYYAVFAQLSKNSEETFTTKLAYSRGITINMTGNNDAAILGLDEHKWSVVGVKNSGSSLPGLNNDNYIALYGNANGGNTITVTSLAGVTIPGIKVYAKNSYNKFFVKVGENQITATDGSYTIKATSFVIGNANSNTTQVQIDSIVIENNITYTSYSTTCTVPTWTMSFDNQGHGAQVVSKEVTHNTTTSAPSAPAAIGWAFSGWYKEPTCENAWDFANDIVTRDITLYAKWIVGWTFLCGVDNYAPHIINSDLTYSVQLEANTTYWFRYTDGVSIKYGLSTNGNIMTKDSHTDWKIHQNNQYDCGIATTSAGEYTFHATEEGELSTTLNITVDYPASVAVTFNLNGHGADIIRYTTHGEALATLPATPTTTGYDFAGWFTDQECTSPWISTEPIAADKIVYAQWTVARTTLYLDAGGSELWDKGSAKFAVYYFNSETDNGWSEFMTNYGDCDAIYRTTIPQGYEYVNFVRLKNTCETPNWTDKWNQTSNKSIDGTWNRCTITAFGENNTDCPANYDSYDPTVVVTFHYNGYTTDCDEQISGPKCTTITLPSGKVVAGKTFNGWSDGNGNTYAAGSTYTMPASDVTLTATYTNWTITLNYNNISTQMDVPETGVVLPTTVPEGAQGAVNNIFIGFTKTQLTEAVTDLPNDFIAAGETYLPTTAGETLYALYRQGDATYQLIKDIKDLRLGAHVVLASIDEDYAMGKEFIAGQDTLPAIVVTKNDDAETITFGKDVQEWILDASDSKDHVGEWSFKQNGESTKYLAAPSGGKDKLSLTGSKTASACFTLAIDASGRATAKSVVATTTTTHNTLSMGENGFFACYRLQDITTPDLAIYQHIGTKYVTIPTPVYRVKSVDMINGRLDKNDYYAFNDTITLSGYANDGYSTSNRYLVFSETSRDTVSKTRGFRMPSYNVVDTLTNRAKQDTITFVVPECVTTPAMQRVDWNSEIELPNVANVNVWNFVGWTKKAINDTTQIHSEIFTTYTVPHVDKDTFYAIYSYDGLETEGFVLSTVNNETTYYLGKYVSGSTNRYFSAVTDKAQALVLYNNSGKLYYHSGDTLAYLQANEQGTSQKTYNLLTTKVENATVWTIATEDGKTSIKTNIGGSNRYLRFNYNNGTNPRYSIYTDRQNPVSEKAPSYTTNPVCALYVHYFATDTEEEPEYSYELGQDGKAIPYRPAEGCSTKRFIGWSENKVTTLRQEAPALVAFTTQTFDRDVNLYAVYAAENGGKVREGAYYKVITETPSEMFSTNTDEYSGKNMRFEVTNVTQTVGGNFQTSTKLEQPATIITDRKIYDLKEVKVNFNKSSNKVTLAIQISEDGENWVKQQSIAMNSISPETGTLTATLENCGDYYVRIQASSEAQSTTYKAEISSFTFSCVNRYWFSDYSTNCNMAATATMSFTNGDDSPAPATAKQADPIGQVITLPTPTMAGKHFEHWTINEVEYNAGDSYKLSHDVTAIATWSDPQLVCTPKTLYVASAKGKTIRSSQTIHISCPDITTGTLTIVNDSNSNGKLHAVITNAEANAETGLNATVAIEFTPNAQNVNRNATMTATIGEEPNQKQVQFQVRGTSLPDDFVIAHQGSDSKWYALPADITAFNTYSGYEITVNGDNATAPQSAVYHLGDVIEDNGHIRLTPTDTTALLTSATTSAQTKIKVGKISDDTENRSLWTLLTTDNSSFTFVNTAANNSLKFNSSNKFGMFATGTTNDTLFRIFKVTTSTTTIPITVTNWTETAFSFTTTETIPTHDAFHLIVNEDAAETATCTPTFELYNVTSSTTFGTQQRIQLQWYKDSKLVATGSVVTPACAKSDITLSSLLTEDVDAKNLDIVVTSGTLTVNADATIHNLDIRSGAAVVINGCTLTINQLVFHGGITDDNAASYNVPSLNIASNASLLTKLKTVYYYLDLSSGNYAPMALPFRATMASVRFTSRPTVDASSQIGTGFNIATYNGEERAKQSQTTTKYWKALKNGDWIEPSIGYIVTAKKLKGETHASLRFSMNSVDNAWTTNGEQGQITITKTEEEETTTIIKNQVIVTAWGVDDESVQNVNKAWNFIANPYMSAIPSFNDEFMYITVPTNTVDGYEQIAVDDNDTEIRPFYGVFVQAGVTKPITIPRTSPSQAPAYLLANVNPEQKAYINLAGASMHDRFGLIVGPQHTNDYEINADLSKELGTANDLRAWLMADETKMAYLAVDDETARTLIPLNLRTPAESEYTFSLRESSRVDDLEGLYLYDYENGAVTNLLHDDYIFSAPAGAVENRFAINAIRQNKAPTDIDDGGGGRAIGDGLKMLKDGHIYIIVNGTTFNAEGKEVTK